MSLTITDLEKLQSEHRDLKFELWDGDIIATSPSDYASDEISIELASVLRNWVRPLLFRESCKP